MHPNGLAQGPQQAVLANEENKSLFFKILARHLRKNEHEVVEASGDADIVIVQTTDNYCSTVKTVVVAYDTDVLVMLVHHYNYDMQEAYMFSESSWNSKAKADCVSIRSIKEELVKNFQSLCYSLMHIQVGTLSLPLMVLEKSPS